MRVVKEGGKLTYIDPDLAWASFSLREEDIKKWKAEVKKIDQEVKKNKIYSNISYRVVSKDGRNTLAVSRAFGDFDFKPGVSIVPDVYTIPVTENTEFLILACDGVWDVLKSEEAVDIVRKVLNSGGSPQDASKTLVDVAFTGLDTTKKEKAIELLDQAIKEKKSKKEIHEILLKFFSNNSESESKRIEEELKKAVESFDLNQPTKNLIERIYKRFSGFNSDNITALVVVFDKKKKNE